MAAFFWYLFPNNRPSFKEDPEYSGPRDFGYKWDS